MPSSEKKKAHDRARMQRKRAENASRIEELEREVKALKLKLWQLSPNSVRDWNG